MNKNNPTPAININLPVIRNAKNIEDILCLATLIAARVIHPDSTLDDSDRYYHGIMDCSYCPQADICLACILNQ
jgi:hypothetical protein